MERRDNTSQTIGKGSGIFGMMITPQKQNWLKWWDGVVCVKNLSRKSIDLYSVSQRVPSRGVSWKSVGQLLIRFLSPRQRMSPRNELKNEKAAPFGARAEDLLKQVDLNTNGQLFSSAWNVLHYQIRRMEH